MKYFSINHVAVTLAILLHGVLLSFRIATTEPVVAPEPLQIIKVRLQNPPPRPVSAVPAEEARPSPPQTPPKPKPLPKPEPVVSPEPVVRPEPDPLPEQTVETTIPSPTTPIQPSVSEADDTEASPQAEPKSELQTQETTAQPASLDWQDGYLASLAGRLERHKIYPVAARRLGLEGEALVQLRLDHNGEVESVQILQSTGHRMLDDAILRMVREAQPLPAPRIDPGEVFESVVPVRFTLRR